jgi:CubicO group peptidase (beta-lactamase class C family)
MKLLPVLAVLLSPPSDVEVALDEMLQSLDAPDAAGAVVAIIEPDEAVERTIGSADVDTPFYVASLAKPFTALSVLHAVESGALELDQPITSLVPGLPESFRPITVRHLMQHRSGLPDVYDIVIACDLGTAPLASNAAAIELIKQTKGPMFEPGSRFLYSNTGYVLLAEALRHATGDDLATYARANLFDACSMPHARYVDGPQATIRSGMHGPGGLLLSLEDVVAFERTRLRDAYSADRLRDAVVEQSRGPHHPLGLYGGGWLHQTIGDHHAERHFGGAFGYSSDFVHFTDLGVTFVVLSNSPELSATDLNERIIRLWLDDRYGEMQRPETVALTPEQRHRFGRFWRETESGILWVLIDRGDQFMVASMGDVKLSVVPVAADRLESVGTFVPLSFELDRDRLVVHHDDGSTTPLEAIPFPPSNPANAAEVAGRYTNAALGASIELVATGNGRVKLVQTDPLISLPPFIPLGRDLLVCDRGAQIDLKRDESGRITGLVLSANRAWGISFEREPGISSSN